MPVAVEFFEFVGFAGHRLAVCGGDRVGCFGADLGGEPYVGVVAGLLAAGLRGVHYGAFAVRRGFERPRVVVGSVDDGDGRGAQAFHVGGGRFVVVRLRIGGIDDAVHLDEIAAQLLGERAPLVDGGGDGDGSVLCAACGVVRGAAGAARQQKRRANGGADDVPYTGQGIFLT